MMARNVRGARALAVFALALGLAAGCSGETETATNETDSSVAGGGSSGSGGSSLKDAGWTDGGSIPGSPCSPVGAQQPCYSGPKTAAGVGVCTLGVQTCTKGGWSDCVGSVLPEASEACNGKDDDCNGQTDEGNPQGGGACSTNLPGPCASGALACENASLVCHSTHDVNDPACAPCAGCLGGHPDCNVACQKVNGSPGGTCAVPTSTDPGNCCSCSAQLDCSGCLAGFATCEAACQNAGYATGYCAVDKSTDPGNCCGCLN